MNTDEATKNNIDLINKQLLAAIEDKSFFDDCFKDHVIHIMLRFGSEFDMKNV